MIFRLVFATLLTAFPLSAISKTYLCTPGLNATAFYNDVAGKWTSSSVNDGILNISVARNITENNFKVTFFLKDSTTVASCNYKYRNISVRCTGENDTTYEFNEETLRYKTIYLGGYTDKHIIGPFITIGVCTPVD